MCPVHDHEGKIILVTGVNGYIASQIGLDVLKAGYILRGTVRHLLSADPLLARPYKDFEDRVQIYSVPDMTKPDAYDEAVKGVTAIIHTASPISANNTTWAAAVTPAVKGATNIFYSALNLAGPQLRSFVMTSSFSAAFDPSKAGHTFNEKDWNTWSLKRCEESGDHAHPSLLYAESKTAAERAIWSLRHDVKPSFAVSTILPGTVIGERLVHPTTPSHLNLTLQPIWALFAGMCKTVPPPIGPATYVSVQDTSLLHLYAACKPAESADKRYLVAAGRAPPQAVADILRKMFPERADVIPVGTPGDGYKPGYGWNDKGEGAFGVDCGLAHKALGKEFIGFEECVKETVEGFAKAWSIPS